MRIAISGSQCLGKSTFVNDIIKQYPQFKKSETTYRNVVTDNNLNINKKADVKGQSMIFNKLVDELVTINPNEDVILDRCVFDSFIYTAWSYMNNKETDIDALFMELQYEMAKYYSDYYDLIIFIPMAMDDTDPVIVNDGLRDIDESYRIEVDELFNTLYQDLRDESEDLAKKIVYINGSREKRMEQFNYTLDCVMNGVDS